jgi:hypothetical protein
MTNRVVDLILIYSFIKRLTTPFEQTEAFKLGIIDKNGKKIKDPVTRQEMNSFGYFDRLVFNVKKIIEIAPGGKSRLASFAAALYLIRESKNTKEDYTQQELLEGIGESMKLLEKTSSKKFKELIEEVPVNVTGTGVVGTGDDSVHWKKMDGRKKDVKEFLRRYMEEKNKRQKIKAKKEIMKRFGLQ